MVGMKAGGSWSYLICQSNRATVANLLLLLLQGQRAKHQFYRETWIYSSDRKQNLHMVGTTLKPLD